MSGPMVLMSVVILVRRRAFVEGVEERSEPIEMSTVLFVIRVPGRARLERGAGSVRSLLLAASLATALFVTGCINAKLVCPVRAVANFQFHYDCKVCRTKKKEKMKEQPPTRVCIFREHY